MKKLTHFWKLPSGLWKTVALGLLLSVPSVTFAQTEISDEAGLKGITDMNGSYKLTADITLSDGFIPIGTDGNPFTGTFDGNGFVIKNAAYDGGTNNKVGFFAVAKGATITKLGLENVNFKGKQDVGGLVGQAVENVTISECYVTGFVTGSDHVGAIIGGCSNENGENKVTDTYSTAIVISISSQAGGMVGTTKNIILDKCYFSGICSTSNSNTGGFVSLLEGATKITNSLVVSPYLNGSGSTHRFVGNNNGRTPELVNNYAWEGTQLIQGGTPKTVTDGGDIAGVEGGSKTLDEIKSADFQTTTLTLGDQWKIEAGALPVLAWQKEYSALDYLYGMPATSKVKAGETNTLSAYSTFGKTVKYVSSNPEIATVDENTGLVTGVAKGDVTITASTEADAHSLASSVETQLKVVEVVYNITTADELDNIRFDLAGEFTLANDIELTEDWIPVGTDNAPFTGKFDGNGHVISGLKFQLPAQDRSGFFGVAKAAEISNVGFENVNINGNADVAAIVGKAWGTKVTSCYVANGYIEGRDHVAAIVGGTENGDEGTTVISNCYATVDIYSRDWQAGGILGTMKNAQVLDSYFAGSVECRGGQTCGIVGLVDGESNNNAVKNALCIATKINGPGMLRIVSTQGRPCVLENNYGLVGDKTISEQDQNYGLGKPHGANLETDPRSADIITTMNWTADQWCMKDGIYPVLSWQNGRTINMKLNDISVPAILLVKGLQTTFDLSKEVMTNYGLTCKSSLTCTLDGEAAASTELVDGVITLKPEAQAGDFEATFGCSDPAFSIINSDEVKLQVKILDAERNIASPEDLRLAAQYPVGHFKLTNDIDMSGENFDGIGSEAQPFIGSFDGQGHKIKNITRRPSGKKTGALINVSKGATITGVGLENVDIENIDQDIAGLVAYSQNDNISLCYVTGRIKGNDHVGAITGASHGSTIKNCYVNATVETAAYQAGGITGTADATVFENCYVAGSVTSSTQATEWFYRAGGIIGLTDGPDCTLTGIVSLASVSSPVSGKFLSMADNASCALTAFTNCLYDEGNEAVSRNEESAATNAYELSDSYKDSPRKKAEDARPLAAFSDPATYAGIGWDMDNVWGFSYGESLPTLRLFGMEQYIEISTVEQLQAINDKLDGKYILTADIDLAPVEWTPIGSDQAPFTGTINGNGHIIKNMLITTNADRIGFISAAKNATISKLGFENVSIKAGKQNVAAVVGLAKGGVTIDQCYVTGTILGNDHNASFIGGCSGDQPMNTVSNSYSTAVLIGGQCGGIAGTTKPITVDKCYFSGYIKANSSGFSNGGGIVALPEGGDDASITIVTNCFSVAPYIYAGEWAGEGCNRILGNPDGKKYTLTNNYGLDVTILDQKGNILTATSDVAGFDGESKTMEELKSADFQTNTVGFGSEWKITDGTLPVLAWQTVPANLDVIYGLQTGILKGEIGSTIDLNAYSLFGKNVVYTSGNTDVATIEGNVVTIVGNGESAITASTVEDAHSNAASASFTLSVVTIKTQIETAEDLDNIRFKLDAEYTLANDIDLTGVDFSPIGTTDAPFTGKLNGNGHIIKGLVINTPEADRVGLFGVTNGATISQVGLESANLKGKADVAGIVGRAFATTISECYVANSYIEGYDHVASLVGMTDGSGSSISNCYGIAEIVSTGYQAGGLVGVLSNGTVEKSYFAGSVKCNIQNTCGIVSLIEGNEQSYIKNVLCLATTIDGGVSLRIVPGNEKCTLENNYAAPWLLIGKGELGTVPETDYNYGLDKPHGANLPVSATSADVITTMGWSSDVWTADGTYPVLKWQEKVYMTIVDVPESVTLSEVDETTTSDFTKKPVTNYGMTLLSGLSCEITGDAAESVVMTDGILSIKDGAETDGTCLLTFGVTNAEKYVLINAEPATTDVTVTLDTDAIDGATADGYKVTVSNGQVIISGLTNAQVALVGMNGQVAAQLSGQSGTVMIDIPTSGVYVVRIVENGTVYTQKVMN